MTINGSEVVMVRTDLLFQIIPRNEIRQAEITSSSTVRWWLVNSDEPFALQFYDEDGVCAERFFADLCDTHAPHVRWERMSADDAEEEIWHRNGMPVTAEAS